MDILGIRRMKLFIFTETLKYLQYLNLSADMKLRLKTFQVVNQEPRRVLLVKPIEAVKKIHASIP